MIMGTAPGRHVSVTSNSASIVYNPDNVSAIVFVRKANISRLQNKILKIIDGMSSERRSEIAFRMYFK